MRHRDGQATGERGPESLQGRAMENVRFIRDTMERAASFTALSGAGTVVVGFTALLAAALATRQAGRDGWLAIWLLEAGVAVTVGFLAAQSKARRLKLPLFSKPARRFVLSLLPPLMAGAILTPLLFRSELSERLPGIWLLLYGTGLVTGGAFSISTLPLMGFCFMVAGAASIFAPSGWGDGLLAMGFGGLHILFGWIILRRHGG